MSDVHENKFMKQFHEKKVNHEKSSNRGHMPACPCDTKFGKLVYLRMHLKLKIREVSSVEQVHDCLFSFSLAARTPTRVFKKPEKSESQPNPKFPSFPESIPGKP